MMLSQSCGLWGLQILIAFFFSFDNSRSQIKHVLNIMAHLINVNMSVNYYVKTSLINIR